MSKAEINYYGYRLAAVNKKNPVTANENILNDKGVMLLSKGSPFSDNRADLIAKHKLIKPLEHSVEVENSLDGRALFEKLQKFAATLPGLNAVATTEEAQKALRKNCLYYEKFGLIRQKLTVMASQLPEVYTGALYSAIAGTLIAMELDMGDADMKTVFIGGLMHNSGFLHLDPELTKNEALLERDESLQVQAHPIIAKHFLDHIPGLPKYIGEAVADHHERTDGTGYPKHKFGTDLTLASQVIAFTDAIVTAYRRCEQYGEHAHQLSMLILQFNANVHFETVFNAAAVLSRKGPMPNTPPTNPPSAREVLSQHERITQTFEAAKKLGFVLMKNTRSRLTKSLASMLGRLATSIISAGITQPEYQEWLSELSKCDDPNEHLNLLKSHIMQEEIEEQMERFKSLMWKTIKKIPAEEDLLIESAIKSYNQIESLRTCEISKAS